MGGGLRSRLSNLADRLAYLRRSRGDWGTIQRALSQLLSPILKIDRFYVVMLYFQSGFDISEKWPDDDDVGTHPTTVETVEELEELGSDFDDYFDLEKCRNFLTGASNRCLVLSRRPRKSGGDPVIGMRLCEIGLFSIWDAKRHFKIPNHILMIHNNVVHPQYRGQRISVMSRKGLYEYGLNRGVDRTVGIIGVNNLSSIKAHLKESDMVRSTLDGRIVRVRLLGGLIDWMTPAEKIKALIVAPPVYREK